MSWSKTKIEIGKTGSADAMATTLTSIGTIKDKSTTMSTAEGETLTATATGGIVVAEEKGESVVTITCRVIEPTWELEEKLIGATEATSELLVKTNVVKDHWSVKITPKNTGAIGLKIRKTSVTYLPGQSEDEGHYADITFKVLACEDGELYKKFRVADSDAV